MNFYSSVDRISFPLLEQKGHDLGERAVVTLAAEAAITTTMTQFKTPTSASSFIFTSLPYYTTTITTTATSTTRPSPQSAPLELFSLDNASPWHQLFPALVVFAILGVLSVLLLLIFLCFCLYRRQRRRRLHSLEESALNGSNKPALFGHTEKVQTPASTATTLHYLGIPETSNNNNSALPYDHHRHHHQQQQGYQVCPTSMYPVSGSAPTTPHHPHRYNYFSTTTPQTMASSLSSPVSSTFVPIETSPLTLVPRAAIWKDPQRRRGVNELDLWEQKQQQQQQQQQRRTTMSTQSPSHQRIAHTPISSTSSTYNKIQLPFTQFPFLQSDASISKDDDDYDDDADGDNTTTDASLGNGRDRPWQRYVQSSSRPVDLSSLNDDDADGDNTTTDASLDNGRDRPWQRYVQSSSRPVDLSSLNDDEEEDQHSLYSASTILHPNPIYNLNQEIDGPSSTETPKTEHIATNISLGGLESSGSSQWLCAPSTFKP